MQLAHWLRWSVDTDIQGAFKVLWRRLGIHRRTPLDFCKLINISGNGDVNTLEVSLTLSGGEELKYIG